MKYLRGQIQLLDKICIHNPTYEYRCMKVAMENNEKVRLKRNTSFVYRQIKSDMQHDQNCRSLKNTNVLFCGFALFLLKVKKSTFH